MNAHPSTLLLVACLAGTADAALVQYTDSASFLAAIEADYYFENFQSLSGSGLPGSLDFGPVNGYGYTASATTNLLSRGNISGDYTLSVNLGTASLQFAFTGDAVTALGGYFFPKNNSAPTTGRINLSFSDGSTWTSNSASPTSFIGFTSSVALTLLTVESPAQTCGGTFYCWANANDLYVGAAEQVPVASTALLLAVGLFVPGLRRGRGVTGRAERLDTGLAAHDEPDGTLTR